MARGSRRVNVGGIKYNRTTKKERDKWELDTLLLPLTQKAN